MNWGIGKKKTILRVLDLLLHCLSFHLGDTLGIYYRGFPRSLFGFYYLLGYIHCWVMYYKEHSAFWDLGLVTFGQIVREID